MRVATSYGVSLEYITEQPHPGLSHCNTAVVLWGMGFPSIFKDSSTDNEKGWTCWTGKRCTVDLTGTKA